MATETSLLDQLRILVKMDDEGRIFAEDNGADSFIAIKDSLLGSGKKLDSNFAETITGAIEAKRRALAQFLTISAHMAGHLRDWAEFLNSLAGSTQGIIDDLIAHMTRTGVFIKSRGFTDSAVVASGVNIGTGGLIRLLEDQRGEVFENRSTGDFHARCTQDANTGAQRNREVFLFQSARAGKDAVQELGASAARIITALDPRVSSLLNSSFDQFGGDKLTPNSVTSWTTTPAVVGDGSDIVFDDTDRFLPAPTENITVFSLDLKVSFNLKQRLDRAGIQIDQFRPYYLSQPFKQDTGAADGTLTIKQGSVSNSVVVSGATPAGWNQLPIVATPDSTLWYANWAEEAADIEIDWARTSGILKIDDIMWGGMFRHDGVWWVVLPGETPFRAGTIQGDDGDRFDWDVSATEAKIQRWFWRHFGRYLPSAVAATVGPPSWEDPA